MKVKKSLEQDKNLKTYLELEKLLNKFFKQANYCTTECITKPKSKIGEGVKGNLGCCYLNYYRHDEDDKSSCDFDLLIKKRREKYGLPANEKNGIDKKDKIAKNKKACRYHTAKGCILKDYKSPLCISFICRPFKVHLIKEYNMYYDFQEIMAALEDVLSCRISKEELEEFRAFILGYIEIIKTKNKN